MNGVYIADSVFGIRPEVLERFPVIICLIGNNNRIDRFRITKLNYSVKGIEVGDIHPLHKLASTVLTITLANRSHKETIGGPVGWGHRNGQR